MNFASFSLLLLATVPTALSASDSIDYGRANPPWKPDKRYRVVSQYDMELRNIVLDIQFFRPEKVVWKGTWFEHKRKGKQEDRFTSSPFSGKYSCNLEYATFATFLQNKNSGSTFRDYQDATIEFHPTDEKGQTVLTDAQPGWFRRNLGLKPISKEVDNSTLSGSMESADFMFREIFETEGQCLDVGSWYFLGWDQTEAFQADIRHHMNVFKREKASGAAKDAEAEALSKVSQEDRNRMARAMVGDGIWANWERAPKNDIGYNVAQAEAKMMSYAIYGQEETRNPGDVWAVDSDTLESFFPLQNKRFKPFSFDDGVLVLSVESIDSNGMVTVKSLKGGIVDGTWIATTLNIAPNTDEKNELRPTFSINMDDDQNNFVRFIIDSRNNVCSNAEMQVLLEDYKGAVPKMEQLSLSEKNEDREIKAKIDGGEILLHCRIATTVEDM